MVGACRSRSKAQAWSTYPSSGFFGRSGSVLPAFLASLPTPGGRTEERGGSSASARTTEDQRGPRRKRRGVFDGRGRRPTNGPPAADGRTTGETRPNHTSADSTEPDLRRNHANHQP